MEIETQRKLPDQYARRLAETNAVVMHTLTDEALRAKAEEFRKRLLEANARTTA